VVGRPLGVGSGERNFFQSSSKKMREFMRFYCDKLCTSGQKPGLGCPTKRRMDARRRMETHPAHGHATQCNKEDAALSQGGLRDAAVLPYT